MLVLVLIGVRANAGTGFSITGALAQGPVFSEMLSWSPPSWQHIFLHNLFSLLTFVLAPGLAVLVTTPALRIRSGAALASLGLSWRAREENPRRYLLCVIAGGFLSLWSALYFGESLASIAAGEQISPVAMLLVLAPRHGIIEFTALLLPFAALLVCWSRTRRALLPKLLLGTCVLSVMMLFVAAHIEAGASAHALFHLEMTTPPVLQH